MRINKVTEDTDQEEESIGRKKSDLAKDIDKLKTSVNSIVSSREKLPQPLFWSLFNSKIKDIKQQKESKRKISDLLGD